MMNARFSMIGPAKRFSGKAWLLGAAASLLGLGCTVGHGLRERSSGLPAGNYQLLLSVDASAAAAPVTGVEVTVQLPKGVTLAAGSDGRIPPSALAAGSGLKGTSLLTGRLDSAQQRAVLSLSAAATASWTGEFARLTVTVPQGVQVEESAFTQANASGFPAYRVVGLNPAHDLVSLTGQVPASLVLKKP